MREVHRDLLFFAEAIVLIGPLTGFVAYSSLLAIVVGYPSLLMSLAGPFQTHDIRMLIALVALPLGGFAVVQLWMLVKCTAKGRHYSFGRKFRAAMVAGAIASAALVFLFGLLGAALGVLPAYVLLGHMAYLQKRLRGGV